MDKKEIRRELWHSREMEYIRRMFLTNLLFGAAMTIWIWLISEDLPAQERRMLLMIIPAIAVLPVLIFCAYRTVGIFRKAESCIFRKVLLDRPVGGVLRDTIYFKVRIKRSDGKEIGAMTHAIFQTRGYGLLMEDYVNKTIMVAYNEETEILTVIG